jgi:SpoVK/Ycf46/Vps4 family AAA+-type ATPase
LKKDEVLEDVQCFLSDEEKAWYANRGESTKAPRHSADSIRYSTQTRVRQSTLLVRWKTDICSYLLYGPPGSGKTTLGE